MNPTEQFLATLYRGKARELYFYLWTLADKRSSFLQSVGVASALVPQLAATSDVYTSVGVSVNQAAETKRRKASEVDGIFGVWADIDIYDPQRHRKENLPKTIDDALAAFVELPPATMVVNSGAGLQLYWLFDQPWIFADDDERREAQAYLEAWKDTLLYHGSRAGIEVDSVHDISRVLRVPGTQNRKSKPYLDCTLVSCEDETRYTRSEMQDFFRKLEAPAFTPKPRKTREPKAATGATVKTGKLVLKEDATISVDQIDSLENLHNGKFRKTWDRKRTDLADTSASVYDMALADMAVMAGWDDQDIAKLIICWRRRHGEELIKSEQYFERTIRKAREHFDGIYDDDDTAAGEVPQTPAMLRESKLQSLRAAFGVNILRIIKYQMKDCRYVIVTDKGEIEIDSMKKFINQLDIRAAIAEAAGVVIKKFTPDQWRRYSQTMVDLLEVEEIEEATGLGRLRGWLDNYFAEVPIVNDADVGAEQSRPFRKDGQVHIIVQEFHVWLSLRYIAEKVSQADLYKDFRHYGGERSKHDYMVNGTKTTRRTWIITKLLRAEDSTSEDEKA